jgi:hypothetical protein
MENKVKGFKEYLNENCGCENELDSQVEIKDIIANSKNVCGQCGQVSENCECKGSCGNCGIDNGGCDCIDNQEIEIGDIVRNVNGDCPNYKSTGRVIDTPDEKSIIYTVTKPSANSFIGQLLNKGRNQLTIDEKYRL